MKNYFTNKKGFVLIAIIFLIIVGYFLYIQSKCNNYSFGNCPIGCIKECRRSHINTDDCDGPGSCVSLTEKIQTKYKNKNFSKQSAEWMQCQDTKPGFEIDWKVKIKVISSFGGLYVKGYIYNYKSYPVHITFDTEIFDIERDYPKIRQEIRGGDILKLKGKCVGVTEEGEIWIEATEYGIYE